MAKTIFKNYYENRKRHDEFKWKQKDKTSLTDQSQLCGASIVEMAKRFGIDAIIAKAEKTIVDNINLQDKLYGNDFTKLFKSPEERLNVKRNLNRLFELIPARIRKTEFNDNVADFINAYTTNDINKLTKLEEIGIVSKTQLEQVKQLNKEINNKKQEIETKKAFLNKLEEMKGGLYENFAKTGNIDFNINQNNTGSNTDL